MTVNLGTIWERQIKFQQPCLMPTERDLEKLGKTKDSKAIMGFV